MENKNKILHHLDSPVHHHLSWLTVAACSLSSFLIITTALFAQEQVNQPAEAPMMPILERAQEPAPQMETIAPLAPPVVNNENPAQPPAQPAAERPVNPYEQQATFAPKENFIPQNPPSRPEQNFNQNSGPSEEERAAQEEKMTKQRLEMMKKGLTKFISEIKRAKNKVTYYKNKTVLPQELTEALAKADEVAAKVKSSADPDELEEVMGDFQDAAQTIQSWVPRLPQLLEIPRMIKKAETEIARAERTYKTDSSKIKKAKLEEALGEALIGFKTAIDEQKTVLSELKELAKTQPEEVLDRLPDEIFGSFDNMWENEKTIQMGLNLKQGLKQMASGITQTNQTIKNLKRKKIDTAELETVLGTLKTLLEEAKKLASAKPLDFETVMDKIDEFMENQQDLNDQIQELTGDNGFMPVMPKQQSFQLNLPQGFIMESQPLQQPVQQFGQGQQTCNINGVEMPGKCEDYQVK